MHDKAEKKEVKILPGIFPERLLVECIPKEESLFRWEVYRDFEYVPASGGFFWDSIVVPAGFKTDFASVPWAFRQFIPKTGRYNEAAVIHDYLCYLWKKNEHSNEYRQEADLIFYEMMELLGVKKVRSKVMWLGVGLYTKALKWKLIRLKKGQY